MKHGIALSVSSSFLFAGLYYYTTVVDPLSGTSIFAWRVLLALPALALFITRARGWSDVRNVAQRLKREMRLCLALLLSAALIGLQLWLFTWAPLHQMALDVSMGYFLLPMVMVLLGRLVYGERLTRIQSIALSIVFIGVVHELFLTRTFSWATAAVMFGYPPYFMLHRALRIGSFSTLWYDMLLLVPAALFILYTQETSVVAQFATFPRLFVVVPVLGLISSLALICYLSASRLLPLGLFGILGYFEPILLFWVAFLFLGEPMTAAGWLTYIPIWIGVLLIAGEGLFKWRREAARSD
jgi:chloramphenicol-sensitive protein RarD